MKHETDQYKILINEYRKIWKDLRLAERKRKDQEFILFLDKERNRIHNELRRIGRERGKNLQDINLDILESERNLADFKLPEFKVFNTKTAMEKVDIVTIIGDNGEEVEYRSPKFDRAQTNSLYSLPKNFVAFIPFGQRDHWHLFDTSGFEFHYPGDREKEQRANKLVQYAQGKARFATIYSNKTWHRGTTLFGVVFSSQDLEYILAVIREYRTELSIDKKYIDEQEVKKEFLEYIKMIIDELLTEEYNEYTGETRKILMDRFSSYLRDEISDGDILSEVEPLLVEATERAVILDMREEVENSEELQLLDYVEKNYPEELNKPTRESMRRK